MDDLLAEFVAETREMLEASAGEIVAWEADPSDGERLDAIFRFVHTVKGNCGFFDFPRLEKLSHAAEDVLGQCRAGERAPDAALVSAVLAIMDRIGAMAEAIEAGEDFPEGGDDALIAALTSQGDADAETAPPTSERAAQADEGPRPKQAVQRSIRLPVDLLDEVMKGVSDMVLARNDLARRLRDAGLDREITGPFERLSGILADVRTSITRMRMQRLETLFGSFPRLVRDLSNELGKQVMVDFEGGDVELDREMVEMVRDPLTHIIRNAIDHGIESPAERLKAGKREIGTLRFVARQSGNRIRLVISDDGQGIDTEKLARKAVKAGIISDEQLAGMNAEARRALIFSAGLSTADSISNVSGRGVGMDVVRSNIEKIGGAIAVESEAGVGTSFHLELPLTLSIMAALTVESSGQLYAVPRSHVEEIVFANAQSVELSQVGDRYIVAFRGQRIPCISLAETLHETRDAGTDWTSKTLLVVRLASDAVFALAVDRVHDHEDVVVKPIAPAISEAGLYAGATLLDDGRPMMLLDMMRVAEDAAVLETSAVPIDRQSAASDVGSQTTKFGTAMVFRSHAGRICAIRMELVRRIDTVPASAFDLSGERPTVVVDGRALPLAGVDGAQIAGEKQRMLRLSDGKRELAFAVAEVLDAQELQQEADPVGAGDLVEGTLLIDDKPVAMLDAHELFVRYGKESAPNNGLVCSLPDDTVWSTTILAPLVQAAGYRIAASHDEDADIHIRFEDQGETNAGIDDPSVLVLHADADRSDDAAIYQYDRDGLLTRLRTMRDGRAAA